MKTRFDKPMIMNDPNRGLWFILLEIDTRTRISLNPSHSLDHSAASATAMRMRTMIHTRKLCWAAPLRRNRRLRVPVHARCELAMAV